MFACRDLCVQRAAFRTSRQTSLNATTLPGAVWRCAVLRCAELCGTAPRCIVIVIIIIIIIIVIVVIILLILIVIVVMIIINIIIAIIVIISLRAPAAADEVCDPHQHHHERDDAEEGEPRLGLDEVDDGLGAESVGECEASTMLSSTELCCHEHDGDREQRRWSLLGRQALSADRPFGLGPRCRSLPPEKRPRTAKRGRKARQTDNQHGQAAPLTRPLGGSRCTSSRAESGAPDGRGARCAGGAAT